MQSEASLAGFVLRFGTRTALLVAQSALCVVLLVGANPRWEAPLVNTRLRKAARKGAKVYGIGPAADLAFTRVAVTPERAGSFA